MAWGGTQRRCTVPRRGQSRGIGAFGPRRPRGVVRAVSGKKEGTWRPTTRSVLDPITLFVQIIAALRQYPWAMTRFVETHTLRILLSLYAVEAAAVLILVGIYKAPIYNWTLLSTKAGAVLVAGGIGLIAAGSLLAREIESSRPSRGRALAFGLTVNVLSGFGAFLLSEATVRVAARKTPMGVVVGAVAVQPTWSELVAQSREVIAGAAPWGTWDRAYFVYDRELGWTVGPNRRSRDGLYFSSVEGIRSAGPNVRIADQTPRVRVALIGDSNAFSLEVPFEESWGYHLQRLLGDEVHVLNFGVDAYGIDQTYLRYGRDVRRWKPDVVVIGFVQHDFVRTMAVYPFVSLGWPGYLVKPRFAIEKGELKLLNVPLPTPEEILSRSQIHQLPYVEYDLGYGATDWYWRFDHGSLAFRFLTSAFPRWRVENPRVSVEATKALNSRLLVELVKSIEQDGSVPLLVFLPYLEEANALARETLARARTPFLDMTECVTAVPADRRKVPSGHHYTGLANLAIARCTAPAVELALRNFGHAAPRADISRAGRSRLRRAGPNRWPRSRSLSSGTSPPSFPTGGMGLRMP